MTKHKEEKELKINQPEGAIIEPQEVQVVSEALLSHQYQKDSPAISTNSVAGYANIPNVVADQIAAKEVAEDKKEDNKPISQAEYDRRIKLDVTDKEYINASLDHWKVK